MSGSGRILAAIMLCVAASAPFAITPASARGSAPNLMSSPGYQRALEESRKRYQNSAREPARAATPRKKSRHRGQH